MTPMFQGNFGGRFDPAQEFAADERHSGGFQIQLHLRCDQHLWIGPKASEAISTRRFACKQKKGNTGCYCCDRGWRSLSLT